MLISIFVLAASLSIDALTIGISYGIRKIKFPLYAILIITLIAFLFSTLSIFIGHFLIYIFPEKLAKLIGILILIFMGIWIILQSFIDKKISSPKKFKPVFNLFIKSLGITIQILRTPEYGDINNSLKIEPSEAIYIGIALSIDSIGAGIGSAVMGINSYFIPLSVAFFQLFFLCLGLFTGKHLFKSNINTKFSTILSGSIIILIALIRIIYL